MTSPQENRADFLARRRAGIGGSDAAAIIGQDPYKTALDIYHEKVGEAPDRPATPPMMRGRILEPTVAELYTELTGRKVRKQPQRVHPDYPWLLGNLDYQILANGNDLGTGLLEIKCPGIRNFLKIQRGGLPLSWTIQGQHYLGVFGYAWMSYAVFNADLWRLIHFDLTRDEDFIHKLQAAETRFWKEHVEKRVPPTLTLTGAEPKLDMPDVAPGDIRYREDDPAWIEAVEQYQQARNLRETSEAVEEQAKAGLKELMGEKGCVEGAGLRAYWRTMPGKKSFDRKALEGSKPIDRTAMFSRIADAVATGEMLPDLAERIQNIVRLMPALDVGSFDKVGKPYDEFRTYALKPDPLEDE